MSVSYLGLSEINGPLVALEGVNGASYDEIVEFVVHLFPYCRILYGCYPLRYASGVSGAGLGAVFL